MSALLDQIKAADDQLHAQVVSVGDRVMAKLVALQQKVTDLQNQIATGQQPSAEDVQETQDMVTSLQADAAALSTIAPTDAPAPATN